MSKCECVEVLGLRKDPRDLALKEKVEVGRIAKQLRE